MSENPTGSYRRYLGRKRKWARQRPWLSALRHHGWWLAHNLLAHPWLGVSPSPRAIAFHDWTSLHLNLFPRLRPSAPPEISDFGAWAWHNIVGHVAIALFPFPQMFNFHDRTAEAMAVRDWV